MARNSGGMIQGRGNQIDDWDFLDGREPDLPDELPADLRINTDDADSDDPDGDPDALESGDDGQARDEKRKKRRKPKKMTEKRLNTIALAYLEKYEASERGFRAMLERRVYRAAKAHGDEPSDYQAMVDAQVEKALGAGFVDNARYAQSQVHIQRGRGASERAIKARLKGKGITANLIDEALAVDERDDESAAWRLAKRRRLGPYRLENREARFDRDIAALCRAGFSFSVARKIISTSPDQAPA